MQDPLIRRKRMSGARRALGMFAVAWLSLALQPCAMAVGEDRGCPDCPPGAEHAGMAHHAAADGAGMPCAVGAVDCPSAETYSHEARGGKSPLQDAQQEDASGHGADGGSGGSTVAALDTTRMLHRMLRDPIPDAARSESPGSRTTPPRNVLFCVYLK